MNRLVRGSVLIAAAVGAWACGGDPFAENLESVTEISATPQAVFVSNTDSQAVVVEALNELGQQNAAEFTLSGVTAGLVVARDTGFGQVIQGPNLETRARYFVKGADSVTFVTGSFVVSAGDVSTTVEVNVVPTTVPIAFSADSAQPGDTITITAPANLSFTDSTIVTFPGAIDTAVVVSVAADGSTIDVVAGPNASGAATFANVVVSYLPGQVFTFTSSNSFATPIFSALGATYSTVTPALTDTVIVTAPPGLRFLPTSTIDFATDTGSLIVGVSPDSTQLSIKVKPNLDTTLTVSGLIAAGAPQFPFDLTDTVAISSVVIDSLPSSFSNTTPAAAALVDLIFTAPFKADPASVAIDFGGITAYVESVSADSSTVTFAVPADVSGNPTVNGVVADVFSFPLPATASLTSGSNGLAGTDDTTTAPALPVPAPGGSTTFYDAGPFDAAVFGADRLYKFTVAANTTLTLTLEWNNTADIDILWADSALGIIGCFGGATGANPETDTCTFAPGTYYLVVDLFAGAPPSLMKFDLSTQ